VKHYLFYISQNYSFQILRPIQQEIRRRGDKAVWFIEGNDVNRGYFKADEEVLESVRDIVDFAPYAVFVPGNVVPSFIPGIKVSLFHGFVGFKTRAKDGVNYSFIIRDCFDLYCTHGPSSTLPFKELEQKHGHFRAIETGYSSMDPYYSAANNTKVKNSRPVILFSSTFSPRMTQAAELLETIKELSQDLRWQWKVTLHPKMDKSVVAAYKGIQHENLSYVETDNLIPLMLEADLMLGDNSSMIIDFLLLNKPVVTFNNQHPMPHLLNITDKHKIRESIEYGLSYPPDLMKEIHSYAQNTHPYTDGKSSIRVLDAVDTFYDNNATLKKKPTNLIRNLKLRKKLKYWNFWA
jgi:hypothetical protein